MIVNVHQRHVGADADRVGELLETWGSPGDRLWRTELAEPTAFDRGLAVGSSGGHGPVRYRVVEHVPGRSVRAKFEPGIGLRGHHGFEVVPKGDGECILRHEAVATAHGSARLTWPLLIRPIHDAVVEDVFDHVERTLTGTTQRPQPTGRLTAFAARRVLARWVEECTEPPGPLQAEALARVDASDCWTTAVLPGDPDSPPAWARLLFGRPGGSVGLLLRARDLAVQPFGLKTAPTSMRSPTGFPLLAQDGDEVLLGLDDSHLDFRVGIAVRDRIVHVTTTVQINSRLGRVYWAVVRRAHPHLVRAMLRRAALPAQ